MDTKTLLIGPADDSFPNVSSSSFPNSSKLSVLPCYGNCLTLTPLLSISKLIFSISGLFNTTSLLADVTTANKEMWGIYVWFQLPMGKNDIDTQTLTYLNKMSWATAVLEGFEWTRVRLASLFRVSSRNLSCIILSSNTFSKKTQGVD